MPHFQTIASMKDLSFQPVRGTTDKKSLAREAPCQSVNTFIVDGSHVMSAASSKKVLSVDDCPINRQLFSRLLQKDGIEVLEAENGAECIDIAKRHHPLVIIMDVMMPVMDGYEATRILRATPETATIPIIMVSARTQEEDLAEGLLAGADEYVYKPIRPREFRLRVASMIRLREAQLDLESANTSLQSQTRLLSKLNQFCEDALVSDGLEATCRHIVETASQLTRSRRVSVLIPAPNRKELEIAYAVGIDVDWRVVRVDLKNSIAGQVFSTQEELVVNLEKVPEYKNTHQYDSACFASVPLISQPLRTQHGAIGVLNVTERIGNPEYGVEDLAVLRQFSQTAAIALHDALTRVELDKTRDSIIVSLTRLSEYRHAETGRHIERVQSLSVLLAEALRDDPRLEGSIDDDFVRNLRRASPLHDIGKVAIPDAVFLKPGKLDKHELEAMQRHTVLGAEALMSVIEAGHDADFLRMAIDISRHHHERYDGAGYPDGLVAQQIPLAARIVSVADCYDAIRMKREYKPARSHDYAARELLKGSGNQFDPHIIQAFCRVEDQFRQVHDNLSEEEESVPEAESAPTEGLEALVEPS